MNSDWRQEFAAVPREPFIPDLIWIDTDDGYVALSKTDDPEAWQRHVAANKPVVTQVDDGHVQPGELGRSASSSCSQPSIVAQMLAVADIRPGMRVLEIGTGTGWNAALLCARLGDASVVSIEVDPELATWAREALRRAGYGPIGVTGDGTAGYPPAAPYDRVLATCAVGEVPYPWVEQTCPGGLVVTPWGTAFCNGALLRMEVGTDGTASGHFGGNLAFMRLRAQRNGSCWLDDGQPGDPIETTTTMRGREIYEVVSFDGSFAVGLRVPNCHACVEDDKEDQYRHVVQLHDPESGSWASVTVERGMPQFVVRQHGPRHLWDEVESAYRWWASIGKPTHDRFGLTISPDGQGVWLDDPGHDLLT